MDGWSRDKIIQIIASDMDRINSRKEEIKKVILDLERENLEFLDALLEQIPGSTSGPLLSKTPKVLRKRNVKRIQTIPEDEMVDISQVTVDTTTRQESEEKEIVATGAGRRSKREASKKAGEIMKQQQSMNLNSKMRRPSNDENDVSRLSKTSSRDSRSKRLRSTRSSDEEQEEAKRPLKQIKNEVQPPSTRSSRIKQPPVDQHASSFVDEEVIPLKATKLSSVKRKHESSSSGKSKRPSSFQSQEPDSKKANIIDETLETPSEDDTIEPSMYEDAIGKAVPIMNSTMKPTSSANLTHIVQTPAANETRNLNSAENETQNLNSAANKTRNLNSIANETQTIKYAMSEPLERMMNVTVVLESVRNMNETVTVSKTSKKRSNSASISNSNTNSATKKAAEVANERNYSPLSVPLSIPKIQTSKLNPVMELEPLITDDDSSPERKLPRGKKLQKKRSVVKTKAIDSEKESVPIRQKRITRSSLMSEDEVDLTPGRKVLGDMNNEKKKDLRNGFKQNVLFSPYAKESVRKRVEAFEQAGLASPIVETESGMRLTRTKTRALAAASENGENVPNALTIAQKLARKSLAKAKQISRTKEAKQMEESKENHLNSVQKLVPNDKLMQKQQQRITPNNKIRPPMPSSMSRIPTTPSNSQSLSNYSKAMTGSRTNIVTNVDSFIQAKGSAQKTRSDEKMLEEKRRRQQEEDAKRKRDEALKAQMEEKKRRREEKEKKNRLAREAKMKEEMEKRLRAEKEKEEKAKLALVAQEKQREEAERKRMAQVQRAQEKEERRRQKEQLRLLQLQEQEEMERQLAEQKRREQEAEKRRLVEAQQVAAATAKKLKAQMLAAQAKKQQELAQNKQQQPKSYKIDSEPDSDSDDELRPKHEIPPWAKPHYRQQHLTMQEYVPMQAIMRLFDVKKCTPDLSELFQGIDKNRLKRTSSAIWKTPPRFSMMEALN